VKIHAFEQEYNWKSVQLALYLVKNGNRRINSTEVAFEERQQYHRVDIQ